jgi:hypothetical protein
MVEFHLWLLAPAIATGLISRARHNGFLLGFGGALMLSVVVGLVLALVLPNGRLGSCWSCEQDTVVGGRTCPHCGAPQSWNDGESVPPASELPEHRPVEESSTLA